MTAWISIITDSEASAELKDALDVARTPHGTVDNVMRVHSHRPNTMRGHVMLYKAVLHDEANTLPTWLQEVIGSYVSLLNGCDYSYSNHWKNASHLIGNLDRAKTIELSLIKRCPENAFEGAELSLLRYAEKLTISPDMMKEDDVWALKRVGFDDGQILEANQIVGYFNYVNRSLNGLGVTTEGDVIGYYQDSGER